MTDLISRKQAIDACLKYNGYGSVWACIMGDIKQLPSVTINDTADEIKVTNCNDNISRQAICDALDIVFADRIKSAGFDSYETADRDTQLVCDGIMKAIDVVLDQPTVDHLAEVSKKDLISRQAAVDKFIKLGDYYNGRDEVKRGIHQCIAAVYDLPSAQPEQQHGRIFQEIVVEYPSISTYPEYEGKPYFSIKYIEDGHCFIGYGTYKPEVLSEYLKKYFMLSAQPERKNGHWVEIGDEPYDEWECDRCGFVIDGSGCIDPEEYRDVYRFCPRCGSDMRGEQE